jgi:uncharacterized protein (TIGR03000 family)
MSLAILTFLAASPAEAGGPVFRNGGFPLGFFAPSYYGYPLDDMAAGYYGGGRYREYYSYGRGYGWANYPGPVPGPVYRHEYSSVLPPQRLRPTAPPPAPPIHPHLTSSPGGNVAYLAVQVPADAEVWLEGTKTRQSGASRLFVSPPLQAGGHYAYSVRARWTEDGRETEQTQEVVIRPGERASVRFPTGPDLEALPTPRKLAPEVSGER